jgi:hypothetical protein
VPAYKPKKHAEPIASMGALNRSKAPNDPLIVKNYICMVFAAACIHALQVSDDR